MRSFDGPEALTAALGEEIGVGDWITVDQPMIDRFAEATGDHQWIHVDPERAARDSPYGATVAHGYLTLSLVPLFIAGVRRLEGLRLSLNYGLDRVRFPAPVLVGSRLRGRVRVAAANPVPPRGLRVTYGVTVEIDGQERPACLADAVVLHHW
ncbi:MaoC family dehydratase [Methylobacterium nodulans]|uniref:MaoC domain protein dehydratase n=1 Tax=Methylobacterium nodulans (strain LMG 21967 / CNCM I-2342 / ORS 2060) TaxID=460265 RepID=B8IED6_METNO|nr:MaoC family dehydratase [Methylobacterium nodulans]ACL59508.1 MaoC domain protein dehydratase [Methylobacterium nodulans ORS 2060]